MPRLPQGQRSREVVSARRKKTPRHGRKAVCQGVSETCEKQPIIADLDPPKSLKSKGGVIPGYDISCATTTPRKVLHQQSKLPPLIVGIDAEWVREAEGRNRVLSYQIFVVTDDGTAGGVILMPDGKRPKLLALIDSAISLARSEGILRQHPKTIYLASHFSRAELSHLADFDRRKRQFASVRKTFITIDRPVMLNWWDKARHHHTVSVRLYDNMLLAPAGSSLEALGAALGLPKLDLPLGYGKHEMDRLLAERPDDYDAYALRDAEIAARYLIRVIDLSRNELNRSQPPPTLGAFAVGFLRKNWSSSDIDIHAVLGTEKKTYREWTGNKPRTRSKTVIKPIREQIDGLARLCFHGGRNEAMACGISHRAEWNDYDLIGAYTTALAVIRMPDWDAAYPSTDVDLFTADTLGIAEVDFTFPLGTRFPSMPVLCDDRGLVFPLRGRAFVGAPEIATALNMGASIVVRNGWIVPWASDVRPFEEFVGDTQQRRGKEKGSFEDRVWKEVGNSLYGKLAQGIGHKTAFDTRSGTTRPLEPSPLTNPLLAAFITSLIRASLAEYLAAVPSDRTVLSATTDGFLTNASMDSAENVGPATTVLRVARQRLCGSPTVIELKHKVARTLVWRTSGQATVEPWPGEKPILAKGGLQLRGIADQNAEVLRLYRERTPTTTVSESHLTSLRVLYEDGGDLQNIQRTKRLRMEFDFKRKPGNVCEVEGLLAFDTEPWETAEAFLEYRMLFERWCDAGRVLKTMTDWRDWVGYLAGGQASKAGVSRRGGLLAQAVRIFRRAYAHGCWGLPGRNYDEAAEKMTAAGYPTTVTDLKNARRARPPPEHTLPAEVPEVQLFLETMTEAFPTFEAGKIIRNL